MATQSIDTGSQHRGAPSFWVASSRMVLASRVHKLLPLLLLMTNAALLTGTDLAPRPVVAALSFVFLLSILGMQVNVLTDANLDRETKPRLMVWLTTDPRTLRAVMWGEAVACVGLLALASFGRWHLTLALLGYGLCFTLYSYNFLARGREVQARLKVFWWGNAACVFGGYLFLWVGGFALGTLPPEAWLGWLGAGAALSGIDYGVFLNECAGDAAEERAHHLRTLPALLGQSRTSGVALLVLFLSFCALALSLSNLWSLVSAVQVAALLWHATIQAASAILALAVVRRGRRRWEPLVDSSFWLSRVGAFVILVGGTWLSR